MTFPSSPVIVVEDDPWLRLIQVVIDPDTPAARTAAFAHFCAHDVPDFMGWRDRVRQRLPALHPGEVRLVADEAGLPAALPGAHAAVVESLPIGNREIEAAGASLRAVQKFGTVLSNIDPSACARAGIAVLKLRRRANISCAEHTMGLMLALARKIHEGAGLVSVEQAKAAGYAPAQYDRAHTPGANWARITGTRNLYGAQLGIIGFGEIGRELAIRAQAFAMRIVYFQRRRLPPEDEERYMARYVSFEELLSTSDFVSVHLPASDTTRGIIGGRELGLLKPGAILINISRPDLVVRSALLDALRSGRLGGFALDPHYDAPGRADDPLLAFPNVIVSPHLAGSPRWNALGDMEELLQNLENALWEATADERRPE